MKACSAIKKIELGRFFFYLISVLILPSVSFAWQGKVVGISDGDTITVLHNNRGEKVRLYGIDTPEKRQDFGNKAKRAYSDLQDIVTHTNKAVKINDTSLLRSILIGVAERIKNIEGEKKRKRIGNVIYKL